MFRIIHTERQEAIVMSDKVKDEALNEVNGGSWFITEEDGKAAGLELRKLNGDEGSWGYLYNTGDYYWRGHYLTLEEANCIVHFTKDYHRQPNSIKEAVDLYKSKF